MSLTINATPGDPTANSFVLETEQIAYMATRLNASAWTTVSGATCLEPEKAAMIEATREISTLLWQGRRVSDAQALSWPRLFVINPDSPIQFFYASTVIPQRVKDATSELAFQFLNLGTTDLASLDPSLQLAESDVDVIKTRYVEPYFRARGLSRFPRVMNYIKPMLDPIGRGTTFQVIRG